MQLNVIILFICSASQTPSIMYRFPGKIEKTYVQCSLITHFHVIVKISEKNVKIGREILLNICCIHNMNFIYISNTEYIYMCQCHPIIFFYTVLVRLITPLRRYYRQKILPITIVILRMYSIIFSSYQIHFKTRISQQLLRSITLVSVPKGLHDQAILYTTKVSLFLKIDFNSTTSFNPNR